MDAITYCKIVWPSGFPWNDRDDDCSGMWDFVNLCDGNRRVLTRAAWEDAKVMVEEYFSKTTDAEIDAMNAEVYLDYDRDMMYSPQKGAGFVYVRGKAGGPYKIAASIKRQHVPSHPRKAEPEEVPAEIAAQEMALIAQALQERFGSKKVKGSGLFALNIEDIAYITSLDGTV